MSAEHRKHARIEASLVCTLATASDTADAVVANLSKGGAAILAPLNAAQVGELVTLMLERSEGLVTLALTSTVVRKEERDGRGVYGLEFEPLPPDDEAQLALLLQLLLAGSGGGRREHPRVAARVEVTCRTETIFRAWLNDLSKGGLSLRATKDVAVGEELVVSFGLPGLKGLVEVRARVSSRQAVGDAFRLGVQFVPLTATEQAQVNRTLDVLLELALPDGEVLEDD